MANREKVDFTASGKPVTHGLASSYNNHKCGCVPCREAWAKYVRDRGYVTRFREREKLKKKTPGTHIKLP